jgi:hypothetical protein
MRQAVFLGYFIEQPGYLPQCSLGYFSKIVLGDRGAPAKQIIREIFYWTYSFCLQRLNCRAPQCMWSMTCQLFPEYAAK